MGIQFHDAQFLVAAFKVGAAFRHTLTIGRQELLIDPRRLEKLLKEAGRYNGACQELLRARPAAKYAEPFFACLGAEKIASLDASDYEGATIIHDLNQPIPKHLRTQFDIVYDGGSLEHIFNFPVAIRSCMDMVKRGGYFILQTPANNFFGHGFYQFSPELFFRVLSEENGYKIERMVAVEDVWRSRWYEIVDPDSVRSRVELVNNRPVLLLIQAKRVHEAELFRKSPQQSDYVEAWKRRSSPVDHGRSNVGAATMNWLRGRLQRVSPRIEYMARRLYSLMRGRAVVSVSIEPKWRTFANRDCFRPVATWDQATKPVRRTV